MRRKQEDRTAEMKARLIEAALDALVVHGYQGASLSVILKQAGVSRGAWAHHYDSKGALIADAARDMLIGAVERARSELRGADSDFASLIDFLWQNFYQGRHRDVLFEMMVACRTDSGLRDALMPVFDEFHTVIDAVWQDVALRYDSGDQAFRDLSQLTIYVLRGIALETLLTGDRPDLAALRRQWARYLKDKAETHNSAATSAVA